MGRRGPKIGVRYSDPAWEWLGDIVAIDVGEYMKKREDRLQELRKELARLRTAQFSVIPIYTLAWYEREIERLERGRV